MSANNLSQFSNDELILKTKAAVSEERKAIVDVLHYLYEVEVRRLHLLRGFSSLWEFAINELGYSGGGADRRIKAMRLIYAVPGTEKSITDGSLSLTNASQLQNFFRAEKKQNGKTYSVEQKRALIETVQHQTTRECEKILTDISPVTARKDKERILSCDEVEIRFTANQKLLNKLNKIKGLIAHKNSNPSYGELFEILAELALEKLDPAQKKVRKVGSVTLQTSKINVTPAPELKQEIFLGSSKFNLPRYIPVKIRQEVWKRDFSQCSFVDSHTKRKCASTYKLQIDHIVPFAMGGATELDNLRLRCAAHNQLAAIQAYGEKKMAQFFGGY